MSWTEINVGILEEVTLDDLTPEQWACQECKDLGLTYDPEEDDPIEVLNEYLYDKNHYWTYIKSGNRLFEIIRNKCYDESDFPSTIIKNTDGSYSYIVQFYNGGACLSEVLEDLVKDIP